MSERVKAVDGLIVERVKDELLVVDPPAGTAYVLNETAAAVFERCAEQTDADEITAGIVEDFEVEAEQARKDVTATIEQLVEMHLLVKA